MEKYLNSISRPISIIFDTFESITAVDNDKKTHAATTIEMNKTNDELIFPRKRKIDV